MIALLSLGLGLSLAPPVDGKVPLLWRDDPGGVAKAAEAGFALHLAKPPDPGVLERLLAAREP